MIWFGAYRERGILPGEQMGAFLAQRGTVKFYLTASGKQVREFAARGEVCKERSLSCYDMRSSPRDARYAQSAYANPSALEI